MIKELIEKFGYPDPLKGPGCFTKTKRIKLDRGELEKVVVEYHCTKDDEEKDYYIMIIHSVALKLVNRLIKSKMFKDSIKNSYEDLSQDLIIVVMKSLEKYNPYEEEYDFYGFIVYEAKNLFRETSKFIIKFYSQLDDVECCFSSDKILLVDIEDYLKRKLTSRQFKICMLKSGIYGKFTNKEIAIITGIKIRTIEREWKFCKEYLTKNNEFKELFR